MLTKIIVAMAVVTIVSATAFVIVDPESLK